MNEKSMRVYAKAMDLVFGNKPIKEVSDNFYEEIQEIIEKQPMSDEVIEAYFADCFGEDCDD